MMKKSSLRKKAELIYFIKQFIRTLPYHFIVMSNVFFVSSIFNKYFEAICFLVSFFSLRYKFKTTYHSYSILICMILTNSIFALSIILCPSIYMYFSASIVFAFVDCFLLWFVQDKIDCIKKLKEFDNKSIWQLNEIELRDYLFAKGIRNTEKQFYMEFVVMIIIYKMSFKSISDKLGFSIGTIKVWSQKCKKKLNIKNWNIDQTKTEFR